MRKIIGFICFMSLVILILGIEQFSTITSLILLALFGITVMPFIWESRK